MLIKFIKLCLLFILIGGGYILYNKGDVRNNITSYIKNIPSVKGISTSKEICSLVSCNKEDVSDQVKSKVNKEIDKVEKKVTNTKISDLINIYSQAQKYAKDFRAFQEYIKEEAENLIKTK